MYLTFEPEDGRRLSCQRRGSGPLVVCIPGGPGMAYFAPLELPGHELLVFAPRGTGESSVPPAPGGYRIAGYADDVGALREHLGLQKLTLYGNSHGACVALAYAGAHPVSPACGWVGLPPAYNRVGDPPIRSAACGEPVR